MGVFGEKHTSLTREQKRQLINHADTHKLRPTEVCDWVLATWGLRIARVTVYSILHKQRASLMAGHRDLYQTMQNSINGAIAAASGSSYGSFSSSPFTNTQATSEDSCLNSNKSSGRVTKGRSGKRERSISSDLSTFSPLESSPGEGARWEGQLKRVREPASVELDRAMVEFLKSSASVDAHGRRLNDAELQSHALRLARGIPSASRMRCSFGWLRHFKRRLGVQWAADRLGRYRWIVEMDQSIRPSAFPSTTRVDAGTQATSTSDAHTRQRQDRVKEDTDLKSYSQSLSSPESSQRGEDEDDDDDELEYHSSSELFGKESEPTTTTASSSTPSKHTRSASTSTSSTTASYSPAFSSQLNSRRAAEDVLGHQPSFALASQSLSAASLAHPSHSTFLNLHPSPLSHSGQQSPSILDSFPSLFESLPSLHNSIPTTVSSSQLLLNNNLASSLANPLNLQTDALNTSDATKANPSLFGMGVDGGMRKVPSKDEAYDMLQSLLLYYEQDHHYIGEQQTLLLPRWIHQQRQIMHSDENDARMMWMRQQQSLVQPTLGVPPLTPSGAHNHHHHHHHAPASSTSSPPLSPLSPLPMSPIGTSASTSATTSASTSAGLEHFGVSAFPSLTSTIEQQMFFAHQQALQQQFALHQQHQQQQQQQRQQSLVFQNL